ncbi:YaiI/YqxD family protein [Tautonia rosea]|uniref:YaiI/YqxD family protein n=1 Tax=Tautonia rosea TaxID=2728037 RepID=UPI001473C282|nr:YaiI/YqxD family protein [Tautonia rosea]
MAIYVDADACPVKDEVYRVARRYGETVRVVANAPLRVPEHDQIELVVVRGGFEAADDWIAEQIGPGDLVVTADIPLADRCLKAGARALGPKGYPFTDDSIGERLATRAILDQLRQAGQYGGGPSAFAKTDRSRFLGKLDEMLVAIRKEREREARRAPGSGSDQGRPGGPM